MQLSCSQPAANLQPPAARGEVGGAATGRTTSSHTGHSAKGSFLQKKHYLGSSLFLLYDENKHFIKCILGENDRDTNTKRKKEIAYAQSVELMLNHPSRVNHSLRTTVPVKTAPRMKHPFTCLGAQGFGPI